MRAGTAIHRAELLARAIVRAALGSLVLAACDSRLVLESEQTSSKAGPWRLATVSTIYEPRKTNYQARVVHFLVLEGPSGEHRAALDELFVWGAGGARTRRDLDLPEFERMKKTRPIARLAPDGHALAWSRDGGKKYHYVALDAGDAPFACLHVEFGSVDDPWLGAPKTRDLVLGILRTGLPGGDSTHAPPDPVVGEFDSELGRAAAYACERKTDPEFALAVVNALVAPGERFVSSSVLDRLIACAADAAKADPNVRKVLDSASRSSDPASKIQADRAKAALGKP